MFGPPAPLKPRHYGAIEVLLLLLLFNARGKVAIHAILHEEDCELFIRTERLSLSYHSVWPAVCIASVSLCIRPDLV